MVSTFMFKISASLFKPTRETLLDYCSYCLIVIALIGVARVWIGGVELREGCVFENSSIRGKQQPLSFGTGTSISKSDGYSGNEFDKNFDTKEEVSSPHDSELKNYGSDLNPDSKNADSKGDSVTNSSLDLINPEKCAKYYQTVFAYILLIESSVLLFSGLMWAKVPKVTHTLNKFMKIVSACEKSDWAKKALTIVTNKNHSTGTGRDVCQSLYSIISSECTSNDMKSLLDTLFHPHCDYRAKSGARYLYEKVQTFCEHHSQKTNIWMTYIIKSLLQFGLWIIIFNINLVLFVVLEFYAMCPEDSTLPCDHDTFLRIIWFMGQTVLLIYAVFNCKTLRWINEKSVIHRWPCCNYINCFRKHNTLYTDDDGSWISCRTYRFANISPVYNDVALLLYLVEEAHPKVLPYFVVFMFPEWKDKLKSFANPGQISEMPIRGCMQMLSSRPPPNIEITDIPSLNEMKETSTSPGKKYSSSVTFYLDSDAEHSDSSANSTSLSPTMGPSSSAQVRCSSSKNTRGTKLSGKQQKYCAVNTEWGKLVGTVVNASPGATDSGCYGATSEDTDEMTALVHRTRSSDSLNSSNHDSQVSAKSIRSSNMSQTNLLLA